MTDDERRPGGGRRPGVGRHDRQESTAAHWALRNAVDIGVLLVQLAETNPRDPLIVAARVAVEIADARWADRRAVIELANDISDDPFWVGYSARHVPFEEIQRRRSVPGPLCTGRPPVVVT